VAGAIIGAVLLAAVLRGHARQIAALRDLQAVGSAGAMRVAAERRLTDARAQVAALGLPADSGKLRDLADTDDQARAAVSQRDAWQASHREAESNLQLALGLLSRELSARGAPVTQDHEAGYRRYVDDCARRREQAAKAARRPSLESQLQDRRQAEEQAADAATRRSTAEQELRTAASACQLPNARTAGLDVLADAIENWLEQRGGTIGEHQQALEEYAILQQLLDGSTLDEMRAEANRLADAAKVAADGLDPAQIASTELGADPLTTLRKLQTAAQDAREKVTELQTTVHERQQGIPSVAEAEEAHTQATARVERLERLSSILGTTRSLLIQAQDSVHQTIAPQLANAIAPHLAAVTAGRYTETTVDPDDLQVRVRAPSGTWRVADRLSYGTAEQVYLLLRAALTQYLTTAGEPCPMILDDPTAYADEARTTAVLQVLQHLSAKRQIILFSHDTKVLAWARDALSTPRDRIIELADMSPA
jgi:DNA repair exonuclease SbcCD ATPase subunit